MVKIEIADEAWDVYKRSWALMGIRTDEELVRIFEGDLRETSISVLENAETELIDDTPEAYVRREIGLEKERLEKSRGHEE